LKNFDFTDEWREYNTGIDYNNKVNLYHKNELHWAFYNDKQWIGIKTNGLSKWTFNICKSAIKYFISFIMSEKVKMKYTAENLPDEPQDDNQARVKQFVELLSNMADMKWEKDKMDSKLRQLMLDGAVTGDYAAYVYWDPNKETGQFEKGDFCTEVVDGQNVMFSNPNNPIVEAQDYILIVGRETVKKLKKEAKDNKISKELIDTITPDAETQYQVGEYGRLELDDKGDNGKCLYIIKLWKDDNGFVNWNKSTKYCPIRKDVNMGIKRYPIAFGNWEPIKNSYHGMSAIEGIIDNQISINQLFAMISYWMKFQAFGKVIYDGTRLNGFSNKLGEALKSNGPVDAGIVYQLQAGNFNGAIMKVIEMAIQYTKDFIGANDALMGQVNPENASGIAIISTAKQASTPLQMISAGRDQFIEDLGLIWGEFFLRKYQKRTVSYRDNEKMVTAEYSTEGIEDILLQCKVDVGPSTYWSEISGIQTLNNLFEGGKITPKQYFERMAKMNVIPDCQGLLTDIEAQETKEQEYTAMLQIIQQLVPPELQQQAMMIMQQASQPQGGMQNGIQQMPDMQ
jgi:hypothetical protein